MRITISNCFQSLYKDAWFLALPLHYRISLKADLDTSYVFDNPRKKGHKHNGWYIPTNVFFAEYN
jgi:hypothetical protein